MSNLLVVIPARGGSKGIPRKNLRLLAGKPLIYYSIKTALKSKFDIDVYVSSEDDEILQTAIQFGAKIHKRDVEISGDRITLDPVIFSCYEYAQRIENKKYDYVITMQPTSPLLSIESLDKAIEYAVSNRRVETILSAKDNTHLSWRKEGGKFIPNYAKRLNRQYLEPNFTETGGFFITRSDIITKDNRIGNDVELFVLKSGEELDIDTYEDWNICEYHLNKKHILFVVTGNNIVGLGHVYNTLLIANDILNHKISFLVDKNSHLAMEVIASKNYPVYIQKFENIIDDVKNIQPDIVINDILDTSFEYISELKKLSFKVINFEDLGTGAKAADLVINAIYPEKDVVKNHFFGHNYFLLRDEFIYSQSKVVLEEVKNILITFGGVDPNNYTRKVLQSIYDYCVKNNILITIITGFGYNKVDTLNEFKNVSIIQNVKNISAYMLDADIIFTSAGRTIFEVSSIGTPAIVLAQNERELTHFFANSQYGFLNLGLGYNVTDKELYEKFIELVKSFQNRKYMSKLMSEKDLKNGRGTVIKLIQDLIKK